MSIPAKTLQALGITYVRESKGIVEYRLDRNGLKILLAENHSKPVVTVMPLYRVGSRNEAVGFTGATHLLDHMMFKSVRDGHTGEFYNFPDRFRPLGGIWNATTWFDRTNYFETVPARHLELCLATEADRMRNLQLREEEKSTEMTVVRNELERGENDPTRVMLQQLYANAFREHPYHHPTIGWTSDVESISIARLKAFYDEYYWPNNATLLVMGDFDSARTLAWIVKYYGVHPASPNPIPVVNTVETAQEGERRFIVKRAGDSPRVIIGYHVPEALHGDNHPLAVAAAVLGGSSPTSRLYKALVDTGLATSTFVWHFQQRDPGMFMVVATPAPGQKSESVESAILAELDRLRTDAPTEDELRRAKVANRKETKLAASDPMALANKLGEAESIADWTFYTSYGEKLDAVTAGDVVRTTSYFNADNRTVGYFTPKDASLTAGTGSPSSTAPAPATFARRTVKKTLSNGLTVLVLPDKGTGMVGLSCIVKAGGYYSPKDKPMVAALTSSLLTAGTTTRSNVQVAEAFEEMGVELGFRADNFKVAAGAQIVDEDLVAMLSLLADLVRNPVFPAKELDTLKRQWLAALKEAKSDPEQVAGIKLGQILYPADSVFADKSAEDSIAELATITRDDLATFHKSAYSPQGAIFAITGEVDASIIAAVEKVFGDWTGAAPAQVKVVAPAMPVKQRVNVFIAEKRNATISIGHPAPISYKSEDYKAARIANAVLGSGFASRLFREVRVKAGLTYGIGSSFANPEVAGAPFNIELSVNPDNVERALDIVNSAVSRLLSEGITDGELAAEVGYAIGTFEVSLRRVDAVAGTLASNEYLGLGTAVMDSVASEFNALTKDAVNAALRKYVKPESFVTVVAGTVK